MKKIILIEDDSAICDAFVLALSAYNYEVTCFRDGGALLNETVDAPDLFILDKNLSGVNGLNICHFLKQHSKYRQVPVLITSADPDVTRLAQEAGADGAIVKPFTLKFLREVVATHTGHNSP